MHFTCHCGHVEVVKALVRAGGAPLISVRDENGLSCLHKAASLGLVEVVKALARAGDESPLLMKAGGLTCLHLAVIGGHVEVVRYLARAAGGRLLHLPSEDGSTVLDLASLYGHKAVREALLAAGAAAPAV